MRYSGVSSRQHHPLSNVRKDTVNGHRMDEYGQLSSHQGFQRKPTYLQDDHMEFFGLANESNSIAPVKKGAITFA